MGRPGDPAFLALAVRRPRGRAFQSLVLGPERAAGTERDPGAERELGTERGPGTERELGTELSLQAAPHRVPQSEYGSRFHARRDLARASITISDASRDSVGWTTTCQRHLGRLDHEHGRRYRRPGYGLLEHGTPEQVGLAP
jgi:hypothetical protein